MATKSKSAPPTIVPAVCLAFNGSGGDLTFVLSHFWGGILPEPPFPPTIENEKWVPFLTGRLKGAVVYSGTNEDGTAFDWLLAWNADRAGLPNCVYTEIRDKDQPFDWGYIDYLMNQHEGYAESEWDGLKSTISINEDAHIEIVAQLYLKV